MPATESTTAIRWELSEADAAELATGVAELTRAGLPLPAGLRALADELPSRRVRAALKEMATRLERGEAIGTVLQSASKRLPPHLHGLLIAGLRTGRLPEVLEEYLQVEERRRQLRRSLQLSLAYPTLLMVMVTVFAFLARYYLMLEMGKIFHDFGSSLPFITQFYYAVMWQILGLLAAFTVLLVFIPVLLSDLPGVRWLSPLANYIPFFGALLKALRLASLSRVTAIFLENKTPLPESLRLAAGGIADVRLAKACRTVAAELEMGRPLVDAVEQRSQFPKDIIPMLDWGQANGALAQAFAAVAETYEGRAKTQNHLIDAVVVPLIFLVVLGIVGIIVAAVVTPLISFMQLLLYIYRSSVTRSSGQIPWEFVHSSMISPILLGVALLATKRLVTLQRDPRNENVIEFGLNLTGWVLIAVGLGGNLAGLMGYYAYLWLVILAFIAVMIGANNRRTLQKSLLWTMASASERFIPLVPAIDYFANDLRGRIGDSSAKIAELLSSGVPLPEALRRVKRAVPSDSLPLIRAGYESGALAQGLREAALATELEPAFWTSLNGKLFYLTALPCFVVSILIFVCVKLLPAYEKIARDFGTSLPLVTRSLISFAQLGAQFWFLTVPLLMPIGFLFFYCVLRFCGAPLFDLPGAWFLMRRKHVAAILETLALTVEHNRPILNAVRSLAECYPQKAIRHRLRWVLFDLERGDSLIETLYCQGLISEADFAVLQAAARAGNLPWAMREMAASNRRRLAYRLNLLMQMLFPPVVLCFGAVVLYIVVALFMPLISLIASLTRT